MNEKSFERYFQNELNKLQNLAREFSQQHPSVAPLLDSHTADPDAARLLEGVAFLTALLNQKLDDEFPEVIHGLTNILFPHYLKPIPALSIVEFTPKVSLREMIKVEKSTVINAAPIDDVECSFATTANLAIYPMALKKIYYEDKPEHQSQLCLDIELLNSDVSILQKEGLDFYLGSSYSEASNLFMLLNNFLQKITVVTDDREISLPLDSLVSKGFNNREESLFSYPKNTLWSYAILQEYFVLPQKFFFFKLNNLDRLKKAMKGSRFRVCFHFKNVPLELGSLSSEAVKLFCTPVINIFETEAEPITVDHYKEMLHVRPPYRYKDKYQVYDIQKVSGYIQGDSKEKKYYRFESFEPDAKSKNIYQVHRKISIVDSKEEVYIALHYNQVERTRKETLSLKIRCTNGRLPERLQLGEISQSSDNSPELATFKNIIPCTMQIESPVNENSLWQFVSHLSINLLTLSDIETFKEMLKLYMFPHSRDKSQVAKNQKRIDAIEEFKVYPTEMVKRGYLLKGHKVEMGIRQDYFASLGDMYLFCSVIYQFLSNYAALNSYVELEVKEKITGEDLKWVPMLGNKKLI